MLQSLELFGFKSFADRTNFDFAPGVTCVVGPNGSGKSNVVDSIKWILGDQSPKSLRGKEMTDVIFQGASNRKPAGFAEATLTFDNTKRVLALDQDQVQIGRRIYRSGEAEYLINRVPARLKDVRELFMGTGAGGSAYSIIEQGRVDQLLQASNVNRRAVFEEAAGISKYKVKKVEAQRKLERVAQNLLRLTDIVKEVEGQLLTLRSQASKAAKYREYSTELKTLRIGLAADDYRDLNARLAAIDEKRAVLSTQIEELSAEAREAEHHQREAEKQVAEVEDRLRVAERKEAENRETLAGHEATIRHQAARQQELSAEFVRLEQQQNELAQRVVEISGELEQTVDHLERFTQELSQRQAALVDAEAQLRDLSASVTQGRDQLEQLREQLLVAVRQTSVLANRVTSLESQRDVLGQQRQKAQQRLEKIDTDYVACRGELARRQATLQSAHTQDLALREKVALAQKQRADVFARHSENQHRLLDMRDQRSGTAARKHLLEDQDRRQEGLGVGVKEILARAKASRESPWNHVLGLVVELLEVDLENAALIEVALGPRAQLIVLDDARPWIDYLNEGMCTFSGRVGFLSLWDEASSAATKPATLTAPRQLVNFVPPATAGTDLSGKPGVIQRADRLVQNTHGHSRLAEQLLSDTWIVATLDDALQLATTLAEPCRFVTLQGELLETNGTLYVGSVRGDTALVSRKSELRSVKADLQKLDRLIALEEETVSQSAIELQQAELQIAHAQAELQTFTQQMAELKSAVASQELDLDRLARDLAEAVSELDRLDNELANQEPQLDNARHELLQSEQALEALRAEIQQSEQQLATLERTLQSRQSEFALEQLDLAKQDERIHNLRNARTRLDHERLQRDLHRAEAERRFRLLEGKRQQIDLELEQTQHILDELTAQKVAITDQVVQLQAEREQARQFRGELVERDLRCRHRLRDLKEQVHADDFQASEIRHQLTNIADRLRDEFQVEVLEVAQSGISALRDHLLEQQTGSDRKKTRSDAAETAEHVDSAEPDTTATDLASQAVPGADADQDVGDERSSSLLSTEERARGDALLAALSPAQRTSLREELEEQVNRIRRKLKQLGQVNTDSLQALDELESRYARLSGQLQDLVEAKNTLEEIIRRLNTESKRLFQSTFQDIRGHFQELFRKLFGGGEGDIVLEDPEDILECGIDIVARPPGKELRSISLLSGGEKTMTAVALLLAIFKFRPSPFCILDEVDAALDEGNVDRYLGVIREFQQWTQFIVITHSKRTMSGADVLYGVTMEEAGVSKRMSVRFQDISADGQIKTSSSSSSSDQSAHAA